MSKNPNVLIVNKRFKSDFTESQKAIAAKHREAGGNVTVRQNCGDDVPETELVNLNRDAAPVSVQSAPAAAPHTAPKAPKMVEVAFANGNKYSIDSSAFGF